MTSKLNNIAAKPLICATAVVFSGTVAIADDSHTMKTHVEHMASENTPAQSIKGSVAKLTTSPAGAMMTMVTSDLKPGHVTTAWWVIITKPMLCESKPCSPKDVIGRADIVGTQIAYADGVVNSPEGTAEFTAYLPSGPVENGWYDQEFLNPTEAEIHLVLNDHGPLVAKLAASMLTSYRGGCRDDSLPPPFPATAKANGIPGPNTCKLIQDSIFQQDTRLSSN